MNLYSYWHHWFTRNINSSNSTYYYSLNSRDVMEFASWLSFKIMIYNQFNIVVSPSSIGWSWTSHIIKFRRETSVSVSLSNRVLQRYYHSSLQKCYFSLSHRFQFWGHTVMGSWAGGQHHFLSGVGLFLTKSAMTSLRFFCFYFVAHPCFVEFVRMDLKWIVGTFEESISIHWIARIMYRSMGELTEDFEVIMQKPNDNIDTFVFASFSPIHFRCSHVRRPASIFLEFLS